MVADPGPYLGCGFPLGPAVRKQRNDLLLARVCEAVHPHRPDGHGAAWAVLVANDDQLTAWVVTEGLTAVKAHELLGRSATAGNGFA